MLLRAIKLFVMHCHTSASDRNVKICSFWAYAQYMIKLAMQHTVRESQFKKWIQLQSDVLILFSPFGTGYYISLMVFMEITPLLLQNPSISLSPFRTTLFFSKIFLTVYSHQWKCGLPASHQAYQSWHKSFLSITAAINPESSPEV